ncbi:MAG: hypothetical protein IT479_03405 [Xanthomonadales bacterium]|nr:hypothetical protein [Xanthomonadales bacterium]MCC6592297.1 hypothetical protein [Xanthomonadales bacterium]MCE7931642.1 hypothetical protein [Xanthomonadales bacterium PRO6]
MSPFSRRIGWLLALTWPWGNLAQPLGLILAIAFAGYFDGPGKMSIAVAYPLARITFCGMW